MAKKSSSVQAKGQLDDRDIKAVTEAVRQSRRPATRRMYDSAWRRFRGWAEDEGVQALPAEPLTVAAYLARRAAAGLSMASIAMDRKAISDYHRRAGFQHPRPPRGPADLRGAR